MSGSRSVLDEYLSPNLIDITNIVFFLFFNTCMNLVNTFMVKIFGLVDTEKGTKYLCSLAFYLKYGQNLTLMDIHLLLKVKHLTWR